MAYSSTSLEEMINILPASSLRELMKWKPWQREYIGVITGQEEAHVL